MISENLIVSLRAGEGSKFQEDLHQYGMDLMVLMKRLLNGRLVPPGSAQWTTEKVKLPMTDNEMKQLMDGVEHMFDDAIASKDPAPTPSMWPNNIPPAKLPEEKCGCGAFKTYGAPKGDPLHADYCPWRKK